MILTLYKLLVEGEDHESLINANLLAKICEFLENYYRLRKAEG